MFIAQTRITTYWFLVPEDKALRHLPAKTWWKSLWEVVVCGTWLAWQRARCLLSFSNAKCMIRKKENTNKKRPHLSYSRLSNKQPYIILQDDSIRLPSTKFYWICEEQYDGRWATWDYGYKDEFQSYGAMLHVRSSPACEVYRLKRNIITFILQFAKCVNDIS